MADPGITTSDKIKVQVTYVLPNVEFLRELELNTDTTLLQAIQCSGVLKEFPEIDISSCHVGIYGKEKSLETVLREHDRVEIYRPLEADPKESRRRRAQKKERLR